jgi:hypothetical protein
MQQQNKTRAQRSGSNAGGLTPTLVPIPMSEDIERMGESPDNLKLNVRACCVCFSVLVYVETDSRRSCFVACTASKTALL